LIEQELDLHILKITYQLDSVDKLEVNLYCNPNGKKTNKLDFFVNMLEPHVWSFSAYSYYGKILFLQSNSTGYRMPNWCLRDDFLSMRNT